MSRIPVEKSALVIGNTCAAVRAVEGLLALGYRVTQFGLAGALNGSDVWPASCESLQGCELLDVQGQVGELAITYRREGRLQALTTSAIVVAVGNERYYPVDRYGLTLAPPVFSVPQMNAQLAATARGPVPLQQRDRTIAVMLDRGGDTPKEMATTALLVAARLRTEWHSDVCVFYRELKVDTPWLEAQTREMRDCGIVFCRYDDAQVEVGEAGVSISFVEGTFAADALVLPEAVRPHPETEALAAALQVRVGEDGLFGEVNVRKLRPGIAMRRGVFYAGHCHLDATPEEAAADGALAAANVDALLGVGWIEPDPIIAHVDSAECIRCLTCVRTCPHAAVVLAEYEQVYAARVMDYACQGCGACVSNCPVEAIELVGQAMPAWIQGA